MDEICTGTEQTNWDLDASEQLEIDGANTSFTLTEDRLVKIEVQLGNGANLLHADGGILAVFAKLTPADTDDKCVMTQKQMRLTATDTLALISLDPFWAKSGSIIEVHARSSNSGDTSVGGMVWIYDVAPASGGDATAANQTTIITAVDAIQDETDKLNNMIDEDSAGNEFTSTALTNSAAGSAAAVVAALMADTGFTSGGTMTYEELMQLLAGMVAGTWRDKPTDSTKQELLDADDDSTVLLEIDLATTTPYKQASIKI